MFTGMEVGVNYLWGYTCVYCNKTIENEAALTCGREGTITKGSAYAVYDEVQKLALLERAKLTIPKEKENYEVKWDNGTMVDENGLLANGFLFEGRCPYCKKEQPWDNSIKKFKNYSETKPMIIMLFTSLTGAAVIAFGIFIIIGLFMKDDPYGIFKWIFLIPFIFSFVIISVYRKMKNIRIGKLLKELEGKEESRPNFIRWTNEWHRYHGSGFIGQ